MENASKALVIAGAVLVSILLVSVGIMIFSGASGIFNRGTQTLSEQEVQAFNNKFNIYEGTMNGSQVRALLTAVIQNNSNTTDNTIVKVNGQTVSDSNTIPLDESHTSTVVSVQKYDVKCETDSNGLIENIKIEEK